MNKQLAWQFTKDSLMIFVPCALGIVLFCWFRTHIVGELDTSQFKQIIDLLPNDWRKFATVDFDWLVSYLGRTALTLDEPMLLLFVCAWPIILGSDVVSGRLGRGTLEMILSQPIQRTAYFRTHAAVTIVGLIFLVLLAWLGMAIGIWTTTVEETTYPVIKLPFNYQIPLTFASPTVEAIPMGTEVNPLQFFPGIANLFFLGFFLCGFSAWCSSWDRYRWRTLGIIGSFYMVGAMLKIGGMSSPAFAWMGKISFFLFYEPASSIQLVESSPESVWNVLLMEDGKWAGFGPLTNYCALFLMGLLFYILGDRTFEKRDLPAPI